MPPKNKKVNRQKRKGKDVRFPPLPQRLNVAMTSTYRWNTIVSAGSITNAYVNVSDLSEFQPYYYDQIMTIYKNWVVVGVEVEYRIVNRSVASEAEVIIFDVCKKAYDAGISLPIAESLPGATRHLLSSAGNDKVITVKRTVPLSKFYPKNFKADSDFWGDLYNSPPIITDTLRKDPIYSVLLYSAANGSDTINFTTDRRIIYHVTFFNFWASNISLNDPIALPDKNSRPGAKDDDPPVNVIPQKPPPLNVKPTSRQR